MKAIADLLMDPPPDFESGWTKFEITMKALSILRTPDMFSALPQLSVKAKSLGVRRIEETKLLPGIVDLATSMLTRPTRDAEQAMDGIQMLARCGVRAGKRLQCTLVDYMMTRTAKRKTMLMAKRTTARTAKRIIACLQFKAPSDKCARLSLSLKLELTVKLWLSMIARC